MWRPLPLQQPHDDEDHQHEHEEGHGEADVESEVGGGELTASCPALPRSCVLVVDQHGQRGPGHGAAGGRGGGAVPAGEVLALAVAASVGGGGLAAAAPPELETVRGAGAPASPGRPLAVGGGAHPGAGPAGYNNINNVIIILLLSAHLFWMARPSQPGPPLTGLGLSQVLCLCCSPRPHCCVQLDQADQAPQLPGTARGQLDNMFRV